MSLPVLRSSPRIPGNPSRNKRERESAMTRVQDLDTPAVTIMLDRLENNIARAQKEMTRHGIANRPHIKTHKIPAIARMQTEAGAIGITCQKLGEAEVFADAGGTDHLLRTYNILGEGKTERTI